MPEMTTNVDIRPKYEGNILTAIPAGIIHKISDLLSSPVSNGLLWREFAVAVTDRRYSLSHVEIEDIAQKSLSLVEKPARAFLHKMGDRDMSVREFCYFLNHPKFEQISMLIRDNTPLSLVVNLPQSLSVSEGESLELRCQAVGFPFPRYTWFIGRQELMGQDKSTLTLTTRMDQAGDYTCRIHTTRDDILFTRTCNVTVTPSEVPIYLSHPQQEALYTGQDVVPHSVSPGIYTGVISTYAPRIIKETDIESSCIQVQIGGQVTLECFAEGSPPLRYIWYRESRLVERQTGGPLLQIDNIQPMEHGTYHCDVLNSCGSVRGRKIQVIVHASEVADTPEIEKHPLPMTVTRKGTANFNIVARGKEPLIYQWHHNGKIIPGATNQKLEVANCEAHQNGWIYSCTVTQGTTGNYIISMGVKLEVCEPMPGIRVDVAGDKVALLIGVSEIIGGERLYAPPNDLAIMQTDLVKLGFKVYSYLNLQKEEILDVVTYYCQSIGEKTYSVFYFSGHGFEHNKGLYMVPSDAGNGFQPQHCVSMDLVTARILEKDPQLNVIITDMCRDIRPSPIRLDPSMDGYTTYFSETKRGNTIELCATSKGKQAYEPVQRTGGIEPGGLVSKLRKHILEKVSIQDIFNKVKEEMDSDTDYRVQIPEVRANNLSRPLSLADKFDHTGYHDMLQHSTELHKAMHWVPPPYTQMNSHKRPLYTIQCTMCFTNVMCVQIEPLIPCSDVNIDGPPSIYVKKDPQPGIVRTRNGQTNEVVSRPVFKFKLFDLQRANRLQNITYIFQFTVSTGQVYSNTFTFPYHPLATTNEFPIYLHRLRADQQASHHRQPTENCDPFPQRNSRSVDSQADE